MEGLNIITLSYLFFRLAPFIIVCYFSLSSVFNQDIKGLIYLGGLMIACVFGLMVGPFFGELPEDKAPVCDMITIGNNGSFSKIPLGIIMLSYTFFYLLYIMINYKVIKSNVTTILLFSILIAGDIIWNGLNKCYNGLGIIGSLVIGGGFGYIWGMVINSINKPNLLYLNVGSDQTVCSRPSKQLFKCTFGGDVKQNEKNTISGTSSIDTSGIFTTTSKNIILNKGDEFYFPDDPDSSIIYNIESITNNEKPVNTIDLSKTTKYTIKVTPPPTKKLTTQKSIEIIRRQGFTTIDNIKEGFDIPIKDNNLADIPIQENNVYNVDINPTPTLQSSDYNTVYNNETTNSQGNENLNKSNNENLNKSNNNENLNKNNYNNYKTNYNNYKNSRKKNNLPYSEVSNDTLINDQIDSANSSIKNFNLGPTPSLQDIITFQSAIESQVDLNLYRTTGTFPSSSNS